MIALDTCTVPTVNRRPSGASRRTVPAASAATASDTLATWSIPENEPATTTATEPGNGSIRWYDPVTGRWLSKDPIGVSGGLNQYVAFANNPVNRTDPFGLQAEWFPTGPDVPPGTIFSYRFDPAPINAAIATTAADLTGKIWTSPNTAIGLALGLANVPFGGSMSFGNNAIQFETTYGNPANGMGALTLGNVVLYSEGANPGMVWPTYDGYDEVCVGKHEEAHTYQYQLLGPFYGPAYLLGGGAFTAGSPYEQAADLYGRGVGSWWPWANK